MICYTCVWLLLLALMSLPGRAEAPRPYTKFSDVLYPVFQHDRCLICHQFNSRRSQGKTYTTHRDRFLCGKCHRPELIGLRRGAWMAPMERLDHTGLGPRETCELIKSNMGGGDVNALLLQHMLDDERIHWALESGITPAGRMPTVPGGYPAWQRAVQDWAASGMPCD